MYYEDDFDYEKETWDAMTDGMYGDMPEGFDGDYDWLGFWLLQLITLTKKIIKCSLTIWYTVPRFWLSSCVFAWDPIIG